MANKKLFNFYIDVEQKEQITEKIATPDERVDKLLIEAIDAEYIYSKIDAEPFILLYTRDIAYRPEVFSKLKSPDFIFSFFDAIVKDKISKKVVTSSIDELIKLPAYKVLIDRMVDAQPVADLKQEEIDGFRQRFCDEIIDIKEIRNVIKKVPVKKSTTKKSKN